jgi:hypothetical protein
LQGGEDLAAFRLPDFGSLDLFREESPAGFSALPCDSLVGPLDLLNQFQDFID